MEEKDVYVGTRIPDDLKKAFQEVLEKDGRNYTIAQILRYWIERFVISGQDQGLNFNSEQEMELVRLREQNKMYAQYISSLNELIDALYKAIPVKEKND